MRLLLLFACSLLMLPECDAQSDAPTSRPDLSSGDRAARQSPVKTGASVAYENGFQRFQGQTVGLIINHTARVNTIRLIDAMHRAGIEIGALFGPEHGLHGTTDVIEGGREPVTGAPIYSLFDSTRAPTPEELEDVDALIFDVQSVGVHFYTYVTTMGLSMQAAAEAEIPFIVFDRPNPLGGQYMSGFVVEPQYRSFVGKYPTPVAYGMTIGELARMIRGEGWLPGLEDLKLEVVEMKHWERDMRWPRTGLQWIRPSPNLPTFEAALAYAGICFFEGTAISEGRGTPRPFLSLGAPWIDGPSLVDTLNGRDLPGVYFNPITFTPEPNAGDSSPDFEGKRLQGIRINVIDLSNYRPVETGIHILHAFYHQAQRKGIEDFFNSYLKSLAGTDRLRKMLRKGARPEAIIAAWQDEVQTFRKRRQPYLLYD